MPFTLSITEARGRTYAAARMLAGLDQADLATLSDLSPATISNVERGKESRSETLKAIRKSLHREGVLVGFSGKNGLATVTISFAAEDDEDE